MSFATEFHVPGAYRFDSSTRARPPLNAGIFRPPSPSHSNYNLAKSTGSLYSDISMTNNTTLNGTTKRKRQSTRESTPIEWNMNMDGAYDGRQEERKLAGGRQFQYTLAGQINATPVGQPNGVETGILEDSVYSDVDYRRALGPGRIRDEVESPSVQFETESPSSDEKKAAASTGWSTIALQVVGKVWEFCKTGSFRGFHAGGGTGYDIEPSTPALPQAGAWCNEHDIPSLPQDDQPYNQLPGQFPRQDFSAFSPQYHEASTPESTPRPAAKRRQVSGHHDELKKNWVLVDEPDEKPRSFGAALSKAAGRPNAPRRSGGYYSQTAASTGRRINVPVSRLGGGTPNSLPRGRASLRISHSGSPNLAAREPASFAAPRSPVTRTTPSRIPVPTASQPANAFAFGGTSVATMSPRPSSRQSRIHAPIPPSSSPTKGHRHNHSNASAAPTMRRSRTGVDKIDADDIQASPRLDAEAKQLAQKKLAAERDTDLRVDAFNARLLSMIRQGREALGTKVEVMDDGGGAGWEDEYDD
ncbi:hypothetical protein B0T16DRAFT_181153 [Cercophora newfieldiana]|uniref:Uncharacterized protein n=1 Tax=Cercophora newfieldiana TaxID=92897 RepID=A0AA39XZW9_9PEZI|nr:hypothetical protein B0T16DRAFT_181153 [Cercophora newfieldiana]